MQRWRCAPTGEARGCGDDDFGLQPGVTSPLMCCSRRPLRRPRAHPKSDARPFRSSGSERHCRGERSNCPDPSWSDLHYNWLRPARNLGYGAGLDFAIENSPARDLYLLTNNDVEFTESHIRDLLEAVELAPDIAVVAPLLMTPSGAIQHGPGRLSRWLRRPINTREASHSFVECDWVSGAVMLIRREAVHAIPFDGSFFLGWEDADWCTRVREAGWRCVLVGEVEVVHEGGTVIGAWWYYYASRNATWYARRHTPLRSPLVWLRAAALVPRVFAADVLKRRGYARSVWMLRGLRDAWRLGPELGAGPHEGEPFSLRAKAGPS